MLSHSTEKFTDLQIKDQKVLGPENGKEWIRIPASLGFAIEIQVRARGRVKGPLS